MDMMWEGDMSDWPLVPASQGVDWTLEVSRGGGGRVPQGGDGGHIVVLGQVSRGSSISWAALTKLGKMAQFFAF